jgi:D-allose transport system ATP-binding protein
MNNLVEMRNITKKFPGVTALSGINFEIKAGEVHVLLGENGAGKSTLMKILSGAYEPTEGTIVINGKEFDRLTPKLSAENGISIIYQELSVINALSIQENLFVGKLPKKSFLGMKFVNESELQRQAQSYLDQIGLKRKSTTMVEELRISEKQMVEIAKATAFNAQVIIMDEPTTSLTNEEVGQLFRIIRELKAQGKGIVYISHKMDEIKQIGDRVSVLKDGTYVGTRNVADVTTDELITMMVGRELVSTFHGDRTKHQAGEVLLKIDHLTRRDQKVRDVSFELRNGEILGFAGLVGAGRTELMEAIFGAAPISKGTIVLKGKTLRHKNPYGAIREGIAMVTENRRETGFFHNFSIRKNISIVSQLKRSGLGGMASLIDFKMEKMLAIDQKSNMQIKCASLEQNITELSGGNQQKVILGKWLAAESKLIIFDEPTKGIDVGTKAEIYKLMRGLAETGTGILVVSSELPELLAVADRIIVFNNGELVSTFDTSEATEEKIVKAATA